MGLFGGILGAINGAVKAVSHAGGSTVKTISRSLPRPPTKSRSPRTTRHSNTKRTRSGNHGVSLPIPKISLPKMPLPKVSLPKISLPKVSLPKVSLPKISLPKVGIPKLPKVDPKVLAMAGMAGPGAYLATQVATHGVPKIPEVKISLPSIGHEQGDQIGDAAGAISGGIDSVINTRDQMYEGGGARMANGDVAGGGASLGGALAADVLLPLDLVSVGNKWATGRGDEINKDELAGAAIDGISLALAIPTLGGSYAIGRALKGGKVLMKGTEVIKNTGKTGGKLMGFGGVAKALKSFNSAKVAGRTTRTLPHLGQAVTKTRRIIPRMAPVSNRIRRIIPKKVPSPKVTKPMESFRGGTRGIHESSRTLGAVENTSKSLKATTAIEGGVKGSRGLKVSPVTAALAGTVGLGAGSYIFGGSGAGTPGGDPGGVPAGGEPDPYAEYEKALEELRAAYEDDEAYIAALSDYIAELEAAIQNGQISPDEGQALIDDAEAEIIDSEGGYFDPMVPYSDFVEEPAQDFTRALDGIPIVGDVLQEARRHGLAGPALVLITAGAAFGGYELYKRDPLKLKKKVHSLKKAGKPTGA